MRPSSQGVWDPRSGILHPCFLPKKLWLEMRIDVFHSWEKPRRDSLDKIILALASFWCCSCPGLLAVYHQKIIEIGLKFHRYARKKKRHPLFFSAVSHNMMRTIQGSVSKTCNCHNSSHVDPATPGTCPRFKILGKYSQARKRENKMEQPKSNNRKIRRKRQRIKRRARELDKDRYRDRLLTCSNQQM